MKTLYLLRHAKAADGDSDFERGLSAQGENDAERMGCALKEKGIKPGVICSSSARRARRTLEILLPHLGIEMDKARFDDELYLATAGTLAELLANLDDSHDSALICGHNPALENLADFYLGAVTEKFPPCACREIRFNTDSWDFASPDTAGETVLITPESVG
jgi:phosphohistidine phosphatase